MMIGSGTEITPHDQQAIDELGQGQLELADQNPAWSGNGKANAIGTGGQRQCEIGDQQGFSHLRLSAYEPDTLCRQQSWLD